MRFWWNGLNDAQQLTLVSTYPGLLARVDGLPRRVRRMARRTRMLDQLTHLESVQAERPLTLAEQRRLRRLRRVLVEPQPIATQPDHELHVEAVAHVAPMPHLVAEVVHESALHTVVGPR